MGMPTELVAPESTVAPMLLQTGALAAVVCGPEPDEAGEEPDEEQADKARARQPPRRGPPSACV